MPQEKISDDELRQGLGLAEAPKPSTATTTSTRTKGVSGDWKPITWMDRLAGGAFTGATGAIGGAKGGPLGMIAGGVAGIPGGAIDPETMYEQGAANLALGPFGPATRMGGALQPFMKAGATGLAAGGANLARTRDPMQALVEAGTTAAGTLSGESLGLMFSPGGLKRGAQEASEKMVGRFRGLFGERPAGLAAALQPDIPALEEVTALASRPNLPQNIKKVLARYGSSRKSLSKLPQDLFENPQLTREFMNAAIPRKMKNAVIGRYLDDVVIVPNMIPVKSGRGVVEAKEIFDAGKALATLKKIRQKDSFVALPAQQQKNIQEFENVLRFLDPSEAIDANSKLVSGLVKVTIFSSMREAAQMRGALQGGVAGVAANLWARVFNPEVRELVRTGSPFSTRAWTAGGTGTGAALGNFFTREKD